MEYKLLSADCVHASSVNMFKNRIDKYLPKAGTLRIGAGIHLEYLQSSILIP